MPWQDYIHPTDPFYNNPSADKTYNGDGTIATITYTYSNGDQYRKTFTWVAGLNTAETAWVKL